MGSATGKQTTFRQTIPVNLVFVGYPRQVIDRGDLLDGLPASYAPVVRYPQFYGLPGRDLGLDFDFRYKVSFAGPSMESRFFRYLARIGEPGEPTDFQQAYNDQAGNVLDVAGPVLYVDGPSAEEWLTDAAGRDLGIDTRHSYTIFFIELVQPPRLQVPPLHQDRRDRSGHRLQLRRRA